MSRAAIGTAPRVAKLVAEIHAACNGRARDPVSIPSSSRRCEPSRSRALSCLATFIARSLSSPRFTEDHSELVQLSSRLTGELLLFELDVSLLRSPRALTDTYSPTAIDIDPATSPATPAIKMAGFEATEAAATPIIRLRS